MDNVLYLVLRRMRKPLILLICVYAIAVLGFVIIPGQDDQGNVWRMGFFHAFYFVSFMGSTIGFGEIPYEFTDAQRLWTLCTIYATVICWLFTIGTLISLLQSPLFQSARTRNNFAKQVAKIREPFLLICGYGDTGESTVRHLADRGKQCVVIDIDPDRINELELEDLPIAIPGLAGDASDPKVLSLAGLNNKYCSDIIAVTDNEQINLKIALASKLISPIKKISCYAETADTALNMASFGTDHIVNPHETFANYLKIALTSPSQYWILRWLSGSEKNKLQEPIFPPNGRWILCGYGRFGKAVHQALLERRQKVTIIELYPEKVGAPKDTITGRGTEAETLEQADIENAVGIVAGTDSDVNNLSIIITAKSLNSKLFTIAREERAIDSQMFEMAKLDMVAHHSRIVSSQLLAYITTPLTFDFIRKMADESDRWANQLASRLLGCVNDSNPHSWVISLQSIKARGFVKISASGMPVKLHHILRTPNNRKHRLPCVALLLRRNNEDIILPDEDTEIFPHDRILIAGDKSAKSEISYLIGNPEALYYTITGHHRPNSIALRWLTQQWEKHRQARNNQDSI